MEQAQREDQLTALRERVGKKIAEAVLSKKLAMAAHSGHIIATYPTREGDDRTLQLDILRLAQKLQKAANYMHLVELLAGALNKEKDPESFRDAVRVICAATTDACEDETKVAIRQLGNLGEMFKETFPEVAKRMENSALQKIPMSEQFAWKIPETSDGQSS